MKIKLLVFVLLVSFGCSDKKPTDCCKEPVGLEEKSKIQFFDEDSNEYKKLKFLVENSDEFKNLVKNDKFFLIDVFTYDSNNRQVILKSIHYCYNNLTINSIVNLTLERVVKIQSFENRSTGLSKQEKQTAINLAQTSDVVKDFCLKHKNLKVEFLFPHVADKQDPLFKHRLVIVSFFVEEDGQVIFKIEVDLTEEKVLGIL